jgi:chromosome partitioning protein
VAEIPAVFGRLLRCPTFYWCQLQPRSFDLWALDQVADLAKEVASITLTLQVLAFLNRADAQGWDNAEAMGGVDGLPSLTPS